MEPVLGTEPGLITEIFPFKCRIVPTSEKYIKLIREIKKFNSYLALEDFTSQPYSPTGLMPRGH